MFVQVHKQKIENGRLRISIESCQQVCTILCIFRSLHAYECENIRAKTPADKWKEPQS